MSDPDQYLQDTKAVVDRALMESLPHAGSSKVADAMRYSVEAGGKRLRPLLCLATAQVLGAEQKAVIDVACALEMIHTYSLIHDDLPAMDDSDLRRGKASCHTVFGEALAILAGDEAAATAAAGDALAVMRESWEPETTARNLRLIREARAARQEALPWAAAIEAALTDAAAKG